MLNVKTYHIVFENERYEKGRKDTTERYSFIETGM